ncbi:MAG: hypothetical protein WB586_20485 [Chthoniobacterales bacterium]
MMLDEHQVQKLLRLKRFEQPPPGYFDRTLEEFHRRQRAELLRRSAVQIWFDRLVSGLWSFRIPASAYGGALGVFVVFLTLMGTGVWGPRSDEGRSGSSLVQTVARASGARLALNKDLDWSDFGQRPVISNLNLVPVIQPSDSSLPRYVLDGHPVSYEASFNF